MGGIPPLGYDVKDRRLVVNDTEAALVLRIFERFLELGSALAVVRELNAEGYLTKSWATADGSFRHGRPFDKGAKSRALGKKVAIYQIVMDVSVSNI